MEQSETVYVAGHRGMVGSAIVRELEVQGFKNIITANRDELDLTRQSDVEMWFRDQLPEYVILSAAKVGGIAANIAEPARFIYDNIMIQTNVIHSAYLTDVKKLLFLGSSCVYPRESPQPMREEYMLSGALEPTNEAYAVAKIAGLKMCEYYFMQYGFKAITVTPPNLFGPGDDFSEERSHVVAAMIRRFHEAKVSSKEHITIWGTGIARREFMFVNDFARCAIELMNHYDDPNFINVGTGVDIAIIDLARMVADVVGYTGEIRTDPLKPDGMPRKLMDSTRFRDSSDIKLTPFREGLEIAYNWFLAQE